MIDHAERTATTKEVILVVFTDGQENASMRMKQKAVLQRVEEKKKLGWTFVFLGADIDSYATGGSLGYARGSTRSHAATAAGYASAWSDVSHAMSAQRFRRSARGYTDAKRLAASKSYFSAAESAKKSKHA